MSRLTALLSSQLYKYPLIPIIVKTHRIQDLQEEIRQLLPEKPLIASFFPRISDMSLSAWAAMKAIPTFNMIGFPAARRVIEDLAQDHRVEKLYLDRTMHCLQTVPPEALSRDGKVSFTTTYWTRRLLGIDQAEKEGFTGKAVKVAVVDSGAAIHEQLINVTRKTTIEGQYTDGVGHGTHVCSTVAGQATKDRYFQVPVQGMAPDANLISIKSLGWLLGIGRESDVIQGVEMALQLGVDVINMSLGSEQVTKTPEEDPYTDIIGKLTREYGKIVCVAAGNSGPDPETTSSPGCVKDAFTVGAWDEINGNVAEFSSRGPVWDSIKPDIVSPGVEIDSASSGVLDVQEDHKSQRYSYMSGTSMATPHATGLVAVGIEMFKSKGATLTRDILEDICKTYGRDKDNDVGYGFLTYDWMKRYLAEKLG